MSDKYHTATTGAAQHISAREWAIEKVHELEAELARRDGDIRSAREWIRSRGNDLREEKELKEKAQERVVELEARVKSAREIIEELIAGHTPAREIIRLMVALWLAVKD